MHVFLPAEWCVIHVWRPKHYSVIHPPPTPAQYPTCWPSTHLPRSSISPASRIPSHRDSTLQSSDKPDYPALLVSSFTTHHPNGITNVTRHDFYALYISKFDYAPTTSFSYRFDPNKQTRAVQTTTDCCVEHSRPCPSLRDGRAAAPRLGTVSSRRSRPRK